VTKEQREYEDGFRAYLEPVSDPAFDRLSREAVKAAVPANDHGAAVLFIADSTTVTSLDHPILVVNLPGEQRQACVPLHPAGTVERR
jgi:hypothetical protein